MEMDMALDFPISTPEDANDTENPRERLDFDIERVIMEFVDEPRIRHDVCPDGDRDDPEEVQRMYEWRHEVRRGNGVLFEGQVFINGIAFKEAVLDYALNTSRNIMHKKYDPVKASFICLGGKKDSQCPWRIYGSIDKKLGKWRVKNYLSKHTCIPNGSCALLRIPVIARLFLDKIRDEPEYFKPKKLEETIRERWKITVSRGQCQQGRYKALDWIDKEYARQFGEIRNYKGEILESNPNSSVEVDCFKNDDGEDVFHRFYVYFDSLRRSWKETCRPLIGLDGSFMRANMKGQVLVALGRDADNAIYPIAWAVVPVENFDNWEWFIKKIQTDLGLEDGKGYIMISDRQNGLIKAVQLVLPEMEHRMCVRHIYGNLKAKYGKRPYMKWLIWQLAWSYNKPDYIVNLDRIGMYDSTVHADVLKSKPETWVRAFQRNIDACCEDVENNSTESFNNTIAKAREKPLVPMLEQIATLAMVRICKRDLDAAQHIGICTEYVTKYLEALHEKASLCKVTRSTNNTYRVELDGCAYRVSLTDRTCTCQRFQIAGIPCEHAYGVIIVRQLVAEEYMCHWFRTSKRRRAYTNGIVPLRGCKFWPDGGEQKVIPNPELLVDKKDKKRKKGRNESPTKKAPKNVKRTVTCSVCKQQRHNSRFHKDKEASQANGPSQDHQASQETFTQVSQGTITQL